MTVERHKVAEIALAACLGIIGTGGMAWLIRGKEMDALRADLQGYSDRAVAAAQLVASANLNVVAMGNQQNTKAISELADVTKELAATTTRQSIENAKLTVEVAKLTEQIKIMLTPR